MNLNQYYTDKKYSDLLVKSFQVESPSFAVDLGFGAGNLLHAAKRRWSEINLIGIDIDSKNVEDARKYQRIQALHLNGFHPDLPSIFKEKYGEIDLLVSNPPYFSKAVDSNIRQILKESGLNNCLSPKIKTIPAELVFLAQNLRLLSASGELGIILPAGLVSGEKWRVLREYLFEKYHISKIIQLPIGSFKKTDAQTFIMIISKKTSNDGHVLNLSHVLGNKSINIDTQHAVQRADYCYYQSRQQNLLQGKIKESDFTIYRGCTPNIELQCKTNSYLHTTKMPIIPSVISLPNQPLEDAKNTIAGDILIARVGRRCLGRTMLITEGTLPISDCVVGVRPKNAKVGRLVWGKLSSQSCQRYFQDVALGVGARYITHSLVKDYLLNR